MNSLNTIRALVPFYYTVYSRLKSVQEALSWGIVYVVPVLVICLYFSPGGVLSSLFFTGLALTALFSVYEIGYMANDVFTVKKENRPTLRIPENERANIEARFVHLCAVRSVYALCAALFMGLSKAMHGMAIYPLQFSGAVLVTALCFVYHNTRRNRWNILSYFFLSSMKYLTPLLLFLDLKNAPVPALLTIALFPLVRSVEDSTKPRYGLGFMQKLVGANDLFRVRYYGMLTILLFLFAVFPESLPGDEYRGMILFFLGLSLYYFVYRTAVLLILKRSSGLRRAFRNKE